MDPFPGTLSVARPGRGSKIICPCQRHIRGLDNPHGMCPGVNLSASQPYPLRDRAAMDATPSFRPGRKARDPIVLFRDAALKLTLSGLLGILTGVLSPSGVTHATDRPVPYLSLIHI